MKILWLVCLGFLFGSQLQGALLDVKITGVTNVGGKYAVQLVVRNPEASSQMEFISLKPGESHGKLKLISFDPVTREAKIQQEDKTITLSLSKPVVTNRSPNAATTESKPAQIPPAKLHGMVFANGEHVAFFEIPATGKNWPSYVRLKQGQREGALEFVGFDPGTGQVKIRENGKERSLSWASGEATVHFQNVPLMLALRLWDDQGWTASSSVMGKRITLRLEGNHSMETALNLVKKAYQDQEVVLLEAGGKLLLAGTPQQEGLMTILAGNFSNSPEVAEAKGREIVPLINFDQMPLGQVLDFYSELTGRTVLRAASLPITTFISLRAKTLSKAEAMAALEAAMALNGFKTQVVGGKFVFVTTQAQSDSVRPIAEKLSNALEKASSTKTPDQASKVPLILFDNMPMKHVCGFYAELAGRTLDKEEILPITLVSLKSRGPLSKPEALAALDAVLALNYAELVPDGDTGLKLLINGRPVPRRTPQNNTDKKP